MPAVSPLEGGHCERNSASVLVGMAVLLAVVGGAIELVHWRIG
jgi:hypothetical protein